jgi:hypothetical protein
MDDRTITSNALSGPCIIAADAIDHAHDPLCPCTARSESRRRSVVFEMCIPLVAASTRRGCISFEVEACHLPTVFGTISTPNEIRDSLTSGNPRSLTRLPPLCKLVAVRCALRRVPKR